MPISIAAIIDGISKIPQATWIGGDPTNPPIIRPRVPLAPMPAGQNTIFDDSGYRAPSSSRWADAVDAVNRRLSTAAGSGGSVGVDAAAWYVSFHGRSDRWGIYIPLSSLPILDELYFSELDLPRPDRWRIVWDILVAHEAAHFAVDAACAWFELLNHAPLRRPVRDRMQESDRWSDTFLPRSSYFEAEEALANGYVLRSLSQSTVPGIREALLRFMRAQPPGYRDGEAASTESGFAAAATEVLRGYLSVWSTLWKLDPGHPALDLSRLLPLASDDLAQCPIWVLNDLDNVGLPASAVRMFSRVAPIVETPEFRKMLKRKRLDDAWERTKTRLSISVPNGSDFKKWPKEGGGMWSVRVTDGVRAHLRQPSVELSEGDHLEQWLACKIGSHKDMGHG
jgi:hypothetical protein